MKLKALGAVIVTALLLSGCLGPNKPRMGMVVDEDTGIMYGSAIERNFVTDASFYHNSKMKVRTRNTSGDEAFDLSQFTGDLKSAYETNGYTPTTADDFGLLVDVNVMYSGQVQSSQAAAYSWLGGVLGSTYGGDTRRGIITATATGAALGHIIGSFDRDNTYMVVARVTFGIVKPFKESRKRVTFSRSEKLKNIDDPNEDEKVIRGGFRKTYTTELAIYAGGKNVAQSEITEEVRRRAVRILADLI
ncbi:complement resistance protein TraT [Magnetovibrio sp. PR-2]|uniref:complement resistance protein TraT n=1 Tax=Magnetovibrio sp. PR-2 TaxID=3120356 RepID=UPI002FCE1B2C